ncbi:MAG: CDP-diacylglycerol--glycerol-3-phosphate 3-phosphatidyltransferase [Saezia sp.]
MFLTTPTLLTWSRIVAIPLIIAIYYVFPQSAAWRDVLATGIFIFAAITDWFDGYLARKLNQTSAFGAFLDPVADKLLVCASLLILLDLSRVNAFIVLIIIGREIGVSALREWMAKIGASSSVAVHMVGKVKTVVQMVAIPFLLLNRQILGVVNTALWGGVLIYLAALLTIISMIYYLRKALPEISKQMQ